MGPLRQAEGHRAGAGRPERGVSQRSTAAFVVGTVVYQAGRLGLSLVAARALGPQVFGEWVLISLLIVYLSAVGLGVTNGAAHQIPFRTGASDTPAAMRIADVATGASLLAGLSSGLLAIAVCSVVLIEPPLTTLALVGLAAALQHPFLLQQVLFRSWFAFGRAAAQLVGLGGVVLVSGVALLPFGLNGLLVAQCVTFMVAIAAGSWLLPHRPRPRLDRQTLRILIGIGFPIMVAGVAYGFLTTIDRWLVASFLTRADVGYYGLVGIVLSGLLLLPQLLSQQFYPRMLFAHGGGSHHRELLHIAHRQGLVAGTVVATSAALTVIGAWMLVPIVLAPYLPSLVPLTVASLGVVAYAFASGYGNLLNTVGLHHRFLVIQAIALCLNVGLAVGLLSAGMGLWAVATASATGMVAYSMMMHRAAAAAASSA